MTASNDKTYLAIDYGARRIGIAKSDPTGTIASPLPTLEVTSLKNAVTQIAALIEEYQPAGLVIGYPLSMSGEKSHTCKEVDELIEKLKNIYDGPIHKIDERLSSAEAERTIHSFGKKVGQNKKRVDQLAAMFILQRFLEGLPQ